MSPPTAEDVGTDDRRKWDLGIGLALGISFVLSVIAAMWYWTRGWGRRLKVKENDVSFGDRQDQSFISFDD